jgi:hypothetical protein
MPSSASKISQMGATLLLALKPQQSVPRRHSSPSGRQPPRYSQELKPVESFAHSPEQQSDSAWQAEPATKHPLPGGFWHSPLAPQTKLQQSEASMQVSP